MKAFVLHGINDLRYDEVAVPSIPGPDWAIVQVKAAGICSSDISRVFQKGTYTFPTILGHEFSGVVHSVGSETYKEWIGRRVGIFPLIPCRKCDQCQGKHYEMCSSYDYVGSRRDGGFAEYVAVPIWNLVSLPDSISYTTAAMLEPLSVALHAIKMGNIKEGQTVAVVGTGMIGICAAQWAKKKSAKEVTVIGRTESKRLSVENLGLNYLVIKDGVCDRNFDVVLEAVGSPSAIEQSINITAPEGVLILMGNPSGDIMLSQAAYWRILRKQILLKGTWNSSYDGINDSDWTDTISALIRNEIQVDGLVSHIFKQEQLYEALELMRDRRETYCKVMTIWNQQ